MSKCKEYTTLSFNLGSRDWIISVWNPTTREPLYFLAQPAVKSPPSGFNGPYLVTQTVLPGEEPALLKKGRQFRTVEKAMEWIEGQL